MKIPSPPLYAPPPGPGPVDVGPGGARSAYDGCYGPEDEPRRGSDSDDVDGTTASSFSSQHQHQHQRSSPPSQHRPQRQRQQEEYSYYGNPPVALYDPNDPGIGYPTQQQMPRPAEGLAQAFDRSSSHELWHREGSHREGSYHEGSWREGEAPHAPPTPPASSSAARRQLLPSVVSLAQKLLPAVLGRLDRRDEVRTTFDHVDDDDFEGMCSPLGSPTSPTKPSVGFDNLKTTGLEESDYVAGRDLGARDNKHEGDNTGEASTEAEDDPEAGAPSFADDESYLPRSAALLVSALRGSARKLKEVEGRRRMSIGDLPSLEDEGEEEEVAAGRDEGTTTTTAIRREGLAGNGPARKLDFDQEAEALLESIRRDDPGKGVKPKGGGSSDGAAASSAAVPRARSAALDDDDDDEGSVGGDAARLERSIGLLRRDLRDVDFSHLDVASFDDGFGDVGGGLSSEGWRDGSEGALGRLRSWLSRGSIVEQKLIDQYVFDGGGGAARGEGSRYADNPVLVWSLALMWAFAVLIAMHPRLAELVEGGDPGQLVDFLEWLFG
ncbi:hypothetical protein ACHAWF_006311 [Thalassiosira exigua]